MKYGMAITLTMGGSPEDILTLARAIEERGFHSLYVPEHVITFDDIQSPFPYTETGEIPGGQIISAMDPLMVLGWLAGQTKTIRLTTSVCIIPQRHPVYTARHAADVDILSGGRLDFGVGIGWLKEEFDALHVPFNGRGARTVDYLHVIKALWSEGVSEHHGEYYDLPACVQTPKPIQRPGPPILMGGNSETAMRRTAQIADGWYPFRLSVAEVSEKLSILNDYLREEGRSPKNFEIRLGAPMKQIDPGLADQYENAGVHQLILRPRGRTMDDQLAWLDEAAKLAFD